MQYVLCKAVESKFSGIVPFMHLNLCCVVTYNFLSIILGCTTTGFDKYHSQKALEPPNLLGLVALASWPGALRVHSLDS